MPEADNELPRFNSLNISVNPNGWGPVDMPAQFLDKPYAPFSKSEKLGKVADFLRSSSWYGEYDGEGNDDAFHIVDLSKATSNKRWGNRKRFGGGGRGGGAKKWWANNNRRGQPDNQKKGIRHSAKTRFNRRRVQWKDRLYRPRDNREKIVRESSVKVQADWKILDQFDFNQLGKLRTKNPAVEDLMWAGSLDRYNDDFDRTSTRKPKTLQRQENKQFFYVTTTDDEVIEQMATQQQGNVFATDVILATLMSATRSVFPWDIIIQRVGTGNNKMVFFDKRSDSELDYLTVHETAHNPPEESDPEKINSRQNLSVEATTIMQNFSQQVLLEGKRKDMDVPNPFFDEEEANGAQPATVAYRYRRWNLSGGLRLVARTELHGITVKGGKDVMMTCFALNEWDHKAAGTADWRQKLDGQRGAVLATELKNNACKLAKWTAQTILAGADEMKLGYVSRKNPKDRCKHQILGTQGYKPNEFARQITLDTENMWGVLSMISKAMMKHPEGKYILAKDPNKSILRLYAVPQDSFESSDDSDSD